MYNQYELTEEGKKRKRKRERNAFWGKWFLTSVFGALTFLPTIFFFAVKAALQPEGFWQQFVVYGVGLYFLGALQLAFLVVYLGALLTVIWSD